MRDRGAASIPHETALGMPRAGDRASSAATMTADHEYEYEYDVQSGPEGRHTSRNGPPEGGTPNQAASRVIAVVRSTHVPNSALRVGLECSL